MLDIKIEKLQIDDNVSLDVYNETISINIKGMNKLAFANYTDELYETVKRARFRVPTTLEQIEKYKYPYSNEYKKGLHQIVLIIILEKILGERCMSQVISLNILTMMDLTAISQIYIC